MNAKDRKRAADEAVKLRLAGATYEQIAQRQSTTVRTVKGRVERAIAASSRDEAEVRHLLDLGRIDNSLMQVTKLVNAGDLKAVDSLLKLQEERRQAQARFEAVRRYGETSLRAATERSIGQMSWLAPSDEAARQAALVASSAVDDLLAAGETSKALYGLPHVVNALKELGGTPLERRELGVSLGEDEEDELTRLRRRRSEGRAGRTA